MSCLELMSFLGVCIYIFHQIWKVFNHYLFKYFFFPFSFGNSVIYMLVCLVSHRSLMLCLFFFILLSFCSFDLIICFLTFTFIDPFLCLPISAAATAKSLQSCLTLCDPIDSSPPGSIIHGIFQARRLEWGAIAFSGAHVYSYRVNFKFQLSVFFTFRISVGFLFVISMSLLFLFYS